MEQQKLTASDGEIGDDFGHAVALFGDTALIGGAAGQTVRLLVSVTKTFGSPPPTLP